MKCHYCGNTATGTLESYYHDGGALGERPICDDCAIRSDTPTEFQRADDPENRPESVYYRLGENDTQRFFDVYGTGTRKTVFTSECWSAINRSSNEWENHPIMDSEWENSQ